MQEGWRVVGFDNLSNYYDPDLKRKRLRLLTESHNFSFVEASLEDGTLLTESVTSAGPHIVIHLAAQAGVRYSLENPRSYIDSNLIGTFNILEAVRLCGPRHLMMASSSSVYGANKKVPFREDDQTDSQVSLYAATKKANESMAHSWSHIHNVPITMLRFFTAYGPWGRPDMALFKFTDSIMNKNPIDIYNNGNHWRDFTYIDDIVRAIYLLVEQSPKVGSPLNNDTLSLIAPYRIVNIGNSKPTKLLHFVETLEEVLKKKAIKNYLPIQAGDMHTTSADISLLKQLTGFQPSTNLKSGIEKFVQWYLAHQNLRNDSGTSS